MKHKKLTLEPIYSAACMVAVVAAGLFTVLRVAMAPIANKAPQAYTFSLCILLLFAAALVAYSALAKKEPVVVRGKCAYVSSAAAAVTGVAFAVFTVLSALNWWLFGAMPYPDKAVPSKLDVVFLFALLITGALAAVWFVLVGVRWFREGQTVCMPSYLLALTPVVWCWVRLIRYITSYVSLVGFFNNVHEVGTMVLETVFFLLLAGAISGVWKKPSRFFIAVSLCTGIFCTVSALSQTWFFIVQDAASFASSALVIAPDFAVAFLAFATAFSQSVGTPVEEDTEEAPNDAVPLSGDETEDGDGAEFLLSDEWFAVYDPEDENADEEDEDTDD